MEIVLFVHISKPLQCLKHDVSDDELREQFFAFLHELVDIHIQEFKYEVKCASFQNYFVKLDYVRMAQFHQGQNFLL